MQIAEYKELLHRTEQELIKAEASKNWGFHAKATVDDIVRQLKCHENYRAAGPDVEQHLKGRNRLSYGTGIVVQVRHHKIEDDLAVELLGKTEKEDFYKRAADCQVLVSFHYKDGKIENPKEMSRAMLDFLDIIEENKIPGVSISTMGSSGDYEKLLFHLV
ncbi:hypothetical protein GF323_01640 [Candidatus Woesearchaeota archaeon]|nr:hypothetical protein [Candidatus Woesearchaeota archaeon]